jgi:hypothetical protein
MEWQVASIGSCGMTKIILLPCAQNSSIKRGNVLRVDTHERAYLITDRLGLDRQLHENYVIRPVCSPIVIWISKSTTRSTTTRVTTAKGHTNIIYLRMIRF